MVIALLSILFSIAIPNFRLFTTMMQKQEINEFKKDLLFARNSAILENRSYMVYFFNDKNTYTIKNGEQEAAIKTKIFNHGLKLNVDQTVGSFVFTPSGAPGNSNTIYINTSGSKTYRVTLTPATGRVEIYLE